MTSPNVPLNAYTDAPEQHPNLILGSLQLLFWLFFRPSAWRNHLARIDSNLIPNFCLAELRRAQWYNPALQRLLIQAYVVWPLLLTFIFNRFLQPQSFFDLYNWISLDLFFSVWLCVCFGTSVSVSFSLVLSWALYLVPVVLRSVLLCHPAFCLIHNVPQNIIDCIGFGMAFGIAACMTFNKEKHKSIDSLFRKVSSSFINLLLSFGAVFLWWKLVHFGWSIQQRITAIVSFNLVIELLSSLILSLLLGILFGIAVACRTQMWRRGLMFGLVVTTTIATVEYMALSMPSYMADTIMGLVYVIVFSNFLFIFPPILTKGFASYWDISTAGVLGASGVWMIAAIYSYQAIPFNILPALTFGLIGILLGLNINSWGTQLLYPLVEAWNKGLYEVDKRRDGNRPSLLLWHSAFWDEFQPRPLATLPKHLVLVVLRNPAEGQAAIKYLSNSYQRWAVWETQLELDAPEIKRCTEIQAIQQFHRKLNLDAAELERPGREVLYIFSHLSQDVDAALQQQSAYNQRLALREVAADLKIWAALVSRHYYYQEVGFDKCATSWYDIVINYLRQLAEVSEFRQEIDCPYITGNPLIVQQEIFVGRKDISLHIEQLILDRRRPPLLLYGQRRMGKTSLLNNLGRLLPNSIIPMFVDLQGPVSSASDYAGFLYNIARAMIDSAQRQSAFTLPPLTRETLAVDPFTSFDEWLDEVEQTLDQNIALLSLDEFEALDDAISKGRFDEQDVLGMLRHLIQHRPRFKLLLAGSHTIEEFQRWASYLINVQVLHISYLKEPEARQLIERPVKDFTLRYEPDAVDRVLQLTRCHPFLVQLLCAEIIYLKNEQDPSVRRLANLADVEAAVPAALSSGSFFFADIQHNQVGAGLALLRFIAAQGEGATVSREVLSRQFADNLDNILELLWRRELIEEVGEGYRFQVELIRCWFVGK